MRRVFVALVFAAALLAPLAAQANLVSDTGFSSPTTADTLTVPNDDGLWLVAPSGSWTFSSGAAVSIGGPDWLLQGCTLPSTCFGPGWQVMLSFEYQSNGTGQVEMVGFTDGQTWSTDNGSTDGNPLTTISLPTNGSLTPFQTSFFLPSGSQNFVALGVGFNLATGTSVTMTVQNVVMDLVAPVTFRLSPMTLNLKSKGNFVTGFIRKPPSCYTLSNIVQDTVQLTYNGGAIPAVTVNSHGNKFMVKFDRGELINLLNGITGPVTLTVTGTFEDGIMFAGHTTIKVIKPGKGKQ
jgi:hypothetical protein